MKKERERERERGKTFIQKWERKKREWINKKPEIVSWLKGWFLGPERGVALRGVLWWLGGPVKEYS